MKEAKRDCPLWLKGKQKKKQNPLFPEWGVIPRLMIIEQPQIVPKGAFWREGKIPIAIKSQRSGTRPELRPGSSKQKPSFSELDLARKGELD